MNYALAILARFPTATLNDFDVLQDDDGAVRIVRWEVKENGAAVAKPALTELEAWLQEPENEALANKQAEQLTPSKLLAYRGLSANQRIVGGPIVSVLDFTREMEGVSGYPIVIPASGLYSVSVSLYSASGTTAIGRTMLEVTRAGESERRTIGEQAIYNYIQHRSDDVLELEAGDEIRVLLDWRSSGEKTLLAARTADPNSPNRFSISKFMIGKV